MIKTRYILFYCFILLLPFNETVYSQDEDDRPSGAFLGEIPPGLEPKVFSSDFLSKDNVVGFTISPDGEEIYYCRFIANNPKIFYTEKIQGQWIFPQQSRFNEDYFGGPPHISPNGKKIYWRSNRPFPEDWPGPRPQPRTREATQYWVSERSENGWNNPRPLQLPISLETNLLGMSTTRDETIYTSISFQIIRIRKNNGSYERVEKLPGFLNGHSPAIAPDESFLIFVQGTPRQLYVSFRDKNDSWTKPQSLGSEINMKRMNGYPSVTPDSRYLFYTVDHKLYWVNTDIIKQLQIAK